MRQLFYYKIQQNFITKWLGNFITKCDSFIMWQFCYKCDSFYKMIETFLKLKRWLFGETMTLEFPADLVTFTEEILNAKLHFLCSDKLTGLQKTNFEKAVEFLAHSLPVNTSLPLETSEIRKVFWCFHRVEKGSIGKE